MNATFLTEQAAHLDRRQRRRLLLATIAKSLLVSVALVTVYFVLPFDGVLSTSSIAVLVVGLVALAAVLVHQVKAIMRDDHPNLRALQAFGIAIPLLVVVFASAYVVMAQIDESNFSTPLTRVSALYFTVTVLSTVGFGDIVPVSDYARLVASVQMLLDLVLIGALVRVLFGAAQTGVASKIDATGQDQVPPDPNPSETEPTP